MFAIAPYLVEVRDSYKQPQDLWDFYNKNNLRDVLLDYYKANLRKYQPALDKSQQRMFMVSQLCTSTPTSVAGVYATGQFGFESDIYSIEAKKITHNRKIDEADMVPFNFGFYMPQASISGQRARGLLLLGRRQALGIRHITIPHLQHYFRNRFQDLTLNIERVVPKLVMEALLKGGALKTIRLIKKNLPQDIADVFSISDRDNIHEIELVIRSKRKSHFSDVNWLLEAFQGKASSASEIITIPSFTHDNLKLEVSIDGRKRTVNVGKPGNFSSNIELENLKPTASGHPDLPDWLREADELASNIVQSWGVAGMSWNSAV
ncbi:MAG: hypothetical protein JNL93_13720 [Pelomonas sp.]|nr:hypothetical protein [Roseateles sp.]